MIKKILIAIGILILMFMIPILIIVFLMLMPLIAAILLVKEAVSPGMKRNSVIYRFG